MKVAILGAGAYGTALGGILAQNGFDIDYYDPKNERERLSDVLDKAKFVVLAVPSDAVPYLLPHLPMKMPLVVATKGLLIEEGLTRFDDYMIMSGPGFAADIKAKQQTVLTITDKRIGEWFRADYMKYELTDDKKGVLMCGALKNAYAIGAGYWGLARETAKWRDFVRDVLSEMKLILALNGARVETVRLSCGEGDLKLTCGFPSRNFEYGDKLRQDLEYLPEKTVEGLSTLRRLVRGEIEVPADAKILRQIMALI